MAWSARQKRVKDGKSAPDRSRQDSIRCPECGSAKVWKDGVRYTRHGEVQRWLCRNCSYRFSESTVKVNVLGQLGETPDSMNKLTKTRIRNRNLALKETPNKLPFSIGEDVTPHSKSTLNPTVGKGLYNFPSNNRNCRVSVSEREAKNLVAATTEERAAGATKADLATIKGKIIEFAWWLQKQGYKSAKNRVSMIKRLVDLGANLWDPESVKEILAKREGWKDGYKMLMTYAYENFLKMEGLSWERPRYRQEQTLPFIPTEEELDQLIVGAGKKVGTFLQGLKDTGADPGELAKLRWIDVNEGNRTVNIRPVKGHNPRILKISGEFIRRLQTMPKESEYIFNYQSLRSGYVDARKRLTRKLNNPRLKAIHFTTFRHWKGTMEYHRTHSLMHVKELLGHKKIQNTVIYVHLEAAIFTDRNDEFHVTVAKNVEEACKLIKVGFEYVTGDYDDGGKIFRKRK